MKLEDALQILSEHSPIDIGRFYGRKDHSHLGVGLFYENIITPLYNEERKLFATVKRTVYIITHECDIDQENNRPFNEYVSFCAVIPLNELVNKYQEKWPGDDRLKDFLAKVARREIQRLVYVPPLSGSTALENGGFVYLNQIDSTHISVFDQVKPIAALSAYGLRELDMAFYSSLFRPKADYVSFMGGYH